MSVGSAVAELAEICAKQTTGEQRAQMTTDAMISVISTMDAGEIFELRDAMGEMARLSAIAMQLIHSEIGFRADQG